MTRIGLAATVALLAACADLTPLTPAVCGNGVVEGFASGIEDCDSSVPEPQRCGDPTSGVLACRYLCTGVARCPDGWGCGRDGICREGSILFTRAATLDVALDQVGVADADADGNPDIVGVRDGRVSVLFGDGAGQIPRRWDREPGVDSGTAAAIGLLDTDRRLDVILAGRGGFLILRGSESGSLEMLAPTSALPDGAPAGLVALRTPDSDVSSLLYFFADAGGAWHAASRTKGAWSSLDMAPLAGRRVTGVALDGSGSEAIALLAGDGLHLLSLSSGSLAERAQVADVSMNGPLVRVGPWLLVADAAGNLQVLGPDLVATGVPVAAPGAGEHVLAAGDLDGDGTIDLVTDRALRIGAEGLTAVPDGTWAVAAIVDVDGDGQSDVVRAGPGGMEIDRARCQPGPGPCSLRLTPIVVTREEVSGLAVGDFDADGVADVVFAQGGWDPVLEGWSADRDGARTGLSQRQPAASCPLLG